jgi:hypothetical protein
VFDALYEDYDSDFGVGEDLFSKISMHNNHKEIYLVAFCNQVDVSFLQKCFQMTDCIWHSLMVMSDIPFEKNKDKSISTEKLEEIAKNAQMVVLRAYDQEGYVFWERNSDSST